MWKIFMAIGALLMIGAQLAALALHVFTVYIAYQATGWLGAILTLVMPGISELYWFVMGWVHTGSPFSDYGLLCISVTMFFFASRLPIALAMIFEPKEA